jgi:hypothetical protein
MDMQTFAVIAAVIGFLATLVYLGLGFLGVRTLQDIRKHLTQRPKGEEGPNTSQ